LLLWRQLLLLLLLLTSGVGWWARLKPGTLHTGNQPPIADCEWLSLMVYVAAAACGLTSQRHVYV
jgi:hypothetical protein